MQRTHILFGPNVGLATKVLTAAYIRMSADVGGKPSPTPPSKKIISMCIEVFARAPNEAYLNVLALASKS